MILEVILLVSLTVLVFLGLGRLNNPEMKQKQRGYTHEITDAMGLPDEMAEAIIETTDIVDLKKEMYAFYDKRKELKDDLHYTEWKLEHHKTQQEHEKKANEIIAGLKEKENVSAYDVISKLEEKAPHAFSTHRIINSLAHEAGLTKSPEDSALFCNIKNRLKDIYDTEILSKTDFEQVEKDSALRKNMQDRKLKILESEIKGLENRTGHDEFNYKFPSHKAFYVASRHKMKKNAGTMYINKEEEKDEKKRFSSEIGHAIADFGVDYETPDNIQIDPGVDEAFDYAACYVTKVSPSPEELEIHAKIGNLHLQGINTNNYEEVKSGLEENIPDNLSSYVTSAHEDIKEVGVPSHDLGAYIIKTLGDEYGYENIPKIFGKAKQDSDIHLSDTEQFLKSINKKYSSWNL